MGRNNCFYRAHVLFVRPMIGMLLFSFFVTALHAQKTYYTQWNNAPMNINPAFTGYMEHNMRVSATYRNISDQGLDEQSFTHVAFEAKPFQSFLTNEFDDWGVGVQANKASAFKGVYSFSSFAASTAYHKALNFNGTGRLTLGFQVAMNSEKVDLSALAFSSQFDVSGYNMTIPNGEPLQAYNNNYMDLNAGIMYSTSAEEEEFFIAVAGHQLNAAKRALFSDSKANPTYNLSLGYTRYINDHYTLNLGGSFNFNDPIQQRIILAGFGTKISSELDSDQLLGGVYYRFNEVLSPFVQFIKGAAKFTVSYDTFIKSDASGVSSRRGLEISASFAFTPSDRYKLAKTSCFK